MTGAASTSVSTAEEPGATSAGIIHAHRGQTERTHQNLLHPVSPALFASLAERRNGQIGYRWQASSWVFGLEAQGDWANLKGSNVSNGFFAVPGDLTNRSRIDAIGLFTGQIGWAWNNALLYVKGGAAVTHDKYEGFVVGFAGDRATDTRWGGAVGAGIEYGFAPNWSLGFEYDRLFMDTRNVSFTTLGALPVASRTDRVGQDIDMVTVRVNWRWGGPVIAKY